MLPDVPLSRSRSHLLLTYYLPASTPQGVHDKFAQSSYKSHTRVYLLLRETPIDLFMVIGKFHHKPFCRLVVDRIEPGMSYQRAFLPGRMITFAGTGRLEIVDLDSWRERSLHNLLLS